MTSLRIHGDQPKIILGSSDDALSIDGTNGAFNINKSGLPLLTIENDNCQPTSCQPTSCQPTSDSTTSCPYSTKKTSSSCEKVYYLSQKDFDDGAYFICHPGKYVLTEDIYCEFHAEKQMLDDGFINPHFTGNSISARANIGIAICTDFVTIDGNGYSIQQSGVGATQNRVFTTIECSGSIARARHESQKAKKNGTHDPNENNDNVCPFMKKDNNKLAQGCSKYFNNNNSSFGGGGPGEVEDTGDHSLVSEGIANASVGNDNITIKNLNFGYSSHFHVHGTNTRGLCIENCSFAEFEVAAIWLNNPTGPVLKNLRIVGMEKKTQPLSQIWAFRTQGTGLQGIVNASYWAIILNQQFGGVNIIFPQPSGGLLNNFNSGLSEVFVRSDDLHNSEELLRDNLVDKTLLSENLGTESGVNRQRVGARGAILKDIQISELKSQMIVGQALSRKDNRGYYVPMLFTNEADNQIGGGGHSGYTAKHDLILECIKDGYAFYECLQCVYSYKRGDVPNNLNIPLENYKIYDKDNNEIDYTAFGEIVPNDSSELWKLMKKDSEGNWNQVTKQEDLLRLADRALEWIKDSDGNYVEGKPVYYINQLGLKQWRPKVSYDSFRFVFTNNYTSTGAINKPYPNTKVKDFSTTALDEQPWYRDETQKHYVATVVIPITGKMLANHAGNRDGTPWWVSRDFSHQEANDLPIDFGGHEMNGVVSIHCDRPWGSLFENIQIANAHNLKDPNTTGAYSEDGVWMGNEKGAESLANMENSYPMNVVDDDTGKYKYPFRIGFSGSSWGIMLNDAGANLVKNVDVVNMLARTAASFAIHMGFGSRGNVVENCRVASLTGGAMWGYVADKGARGNLFKDCEALDVVGGIAAAGFVLRGIGNRCENCNASSVKSIVKTSFKNIDPLKTLTQGGPDQTEVVSAGFLMDRGGTDENEYVTRELGGTYFTNCHATYVHSIHNMMVDRTMEIAYRNGFFDDGARKLDELINYDVLANTVVGGFVNIDQTVPHKFVNCTTQAVMSYGKQTKVAGYINVNTNGAKFETSDDKFTYQKNGQNGLTVDTNTDYVYYKTNFWTRSNVDENILLDI